MMEVFAGIALLLFAATVVYTFWMVGNEQHDETDD